MNGLFLMISTTIAGVAVYMDATPVFSTANVALVPYMSFFILMAQVAGLAVTTAVVYGCLSMALQALGGFLDTLDPRFSGREIDD